MKIPPVETIAETCVTAGGSRYVITQKIAGIGYQYTLYSCTNGDYTRLGKGNSPLELEEKYQIWN